MPRRTNGGSRKPSGWRARRKSARRAAAPKRPQTNAVKKAAVDVSDLVWGPPGRRVKGQRPVGAAGVACHHPCVLLVSAQG